MPYHFITGARRTRVCERVSVCLLTVAHLYTCMLVGCVCRFTYICFLHYSVQIVVSIYFWDRHARLIIQIYMLCRKSCGCPCKEDLQAQVFTYSRLYNITVWQCRALVASRNRSMPASTSHQLRFHQPIFYYGNTKV